MSFVYIRGKFQNLWKHSKSCRLSQISDMSFKVFLGRRALQSSLSVAAFNYELTFCQKKHDTPKAAGAEFSGLLAGANDGFFTTDLNIIAAAQLVKNSDIIFRRSIVKDLKITGKDAGMYLQEVKKKAAQYLEKDEICGRAAIHDKGSFAFITGGSSVGKSKIMDIVVKSIRDNQQNKTILPPARVSVFMVDGRRNADLVDALNGTGVEVGFSFMNIVRNAREALDTLVCKHSGDTDHSVLILDEANAFLHRTGKDVVTTQRAKELLDAMVWNTKQKSLMSVMLVSTDSGLPCHLQDLIVDPNHITRTLLISEPSPRESLALLREKLGVGEHLSAALVDCYGGNVYQICMFLRRLPAVYERAECEINIFMGPVSNICRALDAWVAEGGDRTEMLTVLKELARTGFVPIRSDHNQLARLLTKHNVCTFLTNDTVEYEVPREIRAKRAGLVPASQLLRVLIASELVKIEEDKERLTGK